MPLPDQTRFNAKSLEVVTPPTGSAVALADLKEFLAIAGDGDDNMIQRFIDRATQAMQDFLGRAILTQTLDFYMDGFSAANDDALAALGSGTFDLPVSHVLGQPDVIDLPLPPIASITSIKTFDRGNAEATFPSDAYRLDGRRGRVILNEGFTWPTNLRDREGVVIRYTAGYGAGGIPDPIVGAITAHAAVMYECRGEAEMPAVAMDMARPYRLLDRLAW